MNRYTWLVGLIICGASVAVADAAPPKVVHATPDDGDVVEATVKEIKIEFDQPMNAGGRSIVGGGDSFPKMIGKPRWINTKTIAWTVELQPDHDYWLSINSDRFTNFRSATGEAAEPHPISFKTRAAGAKSPATTQSAESSREQNRRAIETLRRAIDEDYSYRDRLNVDWPARFKEAAPKLEAATSPADFAREAAKLLAPANDLHLSLKVGDRFIATHRNWAKANFDLQSLPQRVPNWTEHDGGVATGRFEGGVAYVLIPGWGNEQRDGLEAAYAAMKDATAMIIDVRPNGGGDEMLARQFAGCFVDSAKVYSKSLIRQGGKFTGPFDRIVAPNAARRPFTGRVVVLMGPVNVSRCESFLLMMKQSPRCTLLGDKSSGSSGNPKPHDLSNGVVAMIPSWQDQFPDGKPLEGVGVNPDVVVPVTDAQLHDRDPVLEAALKSP